MARIVFDLDGTLIDSNPTLWSTANRLLAGLGRGPVSPETCGCFVGHGVARLVEGLLLHTGGVPGGESGPHVARFRALYAADPISGTMVHPGVHPVLAALTADGHGLAVCTQKPNPPTLTLLEGLALMPPITAFTGGDSLDVLKPDPRMLHHAADQLPPGAVLMVGDSETDAATAEAAGVPFLLHTRGYRLAPVDAIPHAAAFDDFADLPTLVTRLLGANAAA